MSTHPQKDMVPRWPHLVESRALRAEALDSYEAAARRQRMSCVIAVGCFVIVGAALVALSLLRV